jgi:hypothetical protein
MRTKASRCRRRRAHPIESLESRTLLSTYVINGTNGTDIWHLEADAGQVFYDGTMHNVPGVTDVLVKGFDGGDVLVVNHTTIPIVFDGGFGDDLLSLTSSTLSQITGPITYFGSSGFDTAEFRDPLNPTNSTYSIAGSSFDRNGFGRTTWDGGCDELKLETGTGSNAIYLNPTSTNPLNVAVTGSTGSDACYADMNSWGAGSVNFIGGGGAGVDAFNVSDYNYTNPSGYTLTANTISRPSRPFSYSGCESVLFQGSGTQPCTYNVTSSAAGAPMSVLGGTSNDTFYVQPLLANGFTLGALVSISGFGGSDSLTYDAGIYNVEPTATFNLSPTQINANGSSAIVNYSGIASLTLRGPQLLTPHNTNYVVTGTSPQITSQTTIFTGNGDNVVTIKPHDASGNLTIPTNLGISDSGAAGNDSVVIDDTASSLPINYFFFNPFGAGAQDIGGMGGGLVGAASDIEHLVIYAGQGNDTFRLDTYKSGQSLWVSGAGGDDVFDFTPVSKNLGANLTSMSSFFFDGAAGNDSIRVYNNNSTAAWTYTCNNTDFLAQQSSYSVNLANTQVEHVFASGGTQADTFLVQSTSPGSDVEFDGAGGSDSYRLGQSGTLQGIRSNVSVDGGTGGTDSVFLFDIGDPNGRTVHIGNGTVGGVPGDDLFGGGGSLHLAGITGTVTINLGTGADTAYAQPDATAAIIVKGADPLIAPGDTLNLALAGAQNFVINGTPNSGNVTSDNLRTLSWTGFEGNLNIDATAPAVVNADFDIGPGRGGAGTSLSVQFSEDVGLLINAGFLSLTNNTSGQTMPPENIALSYDATTFVATFTFQGLPNNVLPDGAYTAQIIGGLIDQFGNPMTIASAPYRFVWSAGTAANDAFRIARDPGTLDYLVYLNNDTIPAFVSDQSTARIVLSGGAGDDLLAVDLGNGNPIAPGGVRFDGGAGADRLAVAGSAGPDDVAFDAATVGANGSQVEYTQVEGFGFDGAGGFDALAVNAGDVQVNSSQHLQSLSVNDGAQLRLVPGANALLLTQQLTMGQTARIDLADNDFVLEDASGFGRTRTPPLTMIQMLINAARNGGAWNGFGITSSSAGANPSHNTMLGAMLAADYALVHGGPFDGESPDDTAVLVKYTWYGDTDFNGRVNFDDYVRTDSGFNNHRTGWTNGDFDGNSAVNFDDFVLIDLAFNSQSGTL